ncbi:MAG: response regulator [Elusimicrobia bacterium]|nr:response regulator [Elusimicrobiota bacterium]
MHKILVVDDNSAFTDLVEMVFGEEFEILKAGDGEEGMKKASEHRPDVILLDVMMPKVSGVEMLRLLQADEGTKSIPVIILTASHFDSSTRTVFEQEKNVNAFLKKPCGVEMLRTQIRSALAKSASARSASS